MINYRRLIKCSLNGPLKAGQIPGYLMLRQQPLFYLILTRTVPVLVPVLGQKQFCLCAFCELACISQKCSEKSSSLSIVEKNQNIVACVHICAQEKEKNPKRQKEGRIKTAIFLLSFQTVKKINAVSVPHDEL